ncbi:ABC transporter permease [Phycicoccus sp. BSK3Z-2]|uniref:ABC transporter permease n=1 Tax=Phycicoccus avicenniae TaxID=2828860 RepID=A0A941HZW9_9MICO|nr:ABC transporter permease [Phycicoccus avicenniae]MBR7742701.1 ABC transporter permease [Phycicoccus avicenniae]
MSDTRTEEAPPPSDGGPREPEAPKDRAGLLAYLIGHQSGVVIVVALVIALLIGAALIRYQGVNPWYAYEVLLRGALVNDGALTRTLQKTAPLVLTGLAVVLPLRVGLFNIGAQGQLQLGAIFGAWVAYVAGGAGFLGAVLGMLVGIVFGSVVGLLVGVLKAYRGVHEVISTIMLNYIVAGVTFWLVVGPLQGESSRTSGIPQTESIPEAARLDTVAGVPVGFAVAVVLAAVCWWVLGRTTFGFRFNTVGANKEAARYAGVPINRVVVLSMLAGAGLAGLAGALEALGTLHRFEPAIVGSLGFDGITIALLARANPLATIPAAFLVGILRTGAAGLQFQTGIAPEIVDLLLALILLMVSIPVLGKWLFRSRADKQSVATTSWGN